MGVGVDVDVDLYEKRCDSKGGTLHLTRALPYGHDQTQYPDYSFNPPEPRYRGSMCDRMVDGSACSTEFSIFGE